MATKKQIARRLRKARAAAEKTRNDAAQAVGVTERTVYAWEQAASMPTLAQAAQLAELYGVGVSDLVGRKGR